MSLVPAVSRLQFMTLLIAGIGDQYEAWILIVNQQRVGLPTKWSLRRADENAIYMLLFTCKL